MTEYLDKEKLLGYLTGLCEHPPRYENAVSCYSYNQIKSVIEKGYFDVRSDLTPHDLVTFFEEFDDIKKSVTRLEEFMDRVEGR